MKSASDNGKGFKQCDAFLNIRIKDNNGDWLKCPKGIPLFKDGNSLEQALCSEQMTDEILAKLVSENRVQLIVTQANIDHVPASIS